MAIYNPKRARELEAAARLAESQRQREMAKGQREQRTTEQILGLVEGLIGAAPQAASAFEQSQAERVLAGERPLEMPEAEDPFTSLGRFLFEPGIQRKAKQMAQEQKAQRLQTAEPLLREAIKAPGVKTPAKFKGEPEVLGAPFADFGAVKEPGVPYAIEPEVKFTPREAGMQQLMRDPALALLPEREREAALAGLEQRIGAEQAAAEAAAAERDLQTRMAEAEIGRKEAQAAKFLSEAESKKQQVAPAKLKELSKAIVAGVRSYAQNLKDGLNSTDPNIRGEAIDKLNEQVLLEAGTIRNADGSIISPESPVARAAAGEAVAQIAKELELPKLASSDLNEFATAKNTIEEVANLVERRKNLGDFPVGAVDVIAQRFAQATPALLGARDFIDEMRKLALENGMSNEQFSWLKDAQILKNRLITEEFRGTGAISDQERASVRDDVLTPIASYEQFRQRAYDTLRNISNKFVGRVSVYREVNQIPSVVTSFADRLNKVIGGDREKIALAIIGETPPGSQKAAYELTEETGSEAVAKLGIAPGTVAGGVVSQGIDFLKDVISTAFGGPEEEMQLIAQGAKFTYKASDLAKMAAEEPELFNALISQNPEMAKKLKEIAEAAR